MPPPTNRTNRDKTSGRPSTTTPMSERQQMALLMQMTSSNESESSSGNPSAKTKEKLNDRGETSLHICAKKGDLDGAKKLLDQGVDPNVSDFAGWTPLHEASNHGHYHIAQLLIKHGANVNSSGYEDNTPLHDAAILGNQKLVKLLVDKGANPSFKNKKGKSPKDVAHQSLLSYFASLGNEMTNKKDSQQQNQSQKKPPPTDTKKPLESDEGTQGTSSSNQQTDVYEFVSTPKHSSCSSGDENPKQSDKSSDEKSGSDSIASSQQVKRPLSGGDHQQQEEENENSEEESKRKKRKDSELKESTTAGGSGGKSTSSVVNKDKNNPRAASYKPPGPASKTINVNANKTASNTVTNTTTSDRKSPSEIPTKSPENEAESDDGPKVPPLKIVINPQQSGSENQETQNVNNPRTTSHNKTGVTSRNHPYIVSSMNANENSSTSEITGRSQSPSVDSNKSEDNKTKSKEPRVLRSSRKDGKDDRGSNNSSPQLPISSTPSPSNQNEVNESDSLPATSTTTSVSNSITGNAIPAPVQSVAPSTSQQPQTQNLVELHPRKRKIKASSREPSSSADTKDSNSKDGNEKVENLHPHEQPFTNCYQMYIDLRKQIEQRHRNLHPVEPRPLKGIEDYLMNRRTYLLHGKSCTEPNIIIPPLLPPQMKDLFIEQEKERNKLKLRHIVEKEKMVLSKEQEILRVHCKAAQMIANQSQPFSVCTILKDEEVYSMITPEQEEKYRNKNRERSHGRVFFQALKDLDDKYDKIKEAMIIRQTNEAESLNAVQKMDWGWKMKEFSLCEYKANPEIEELFVPMIDVSDEIYCATRETF